jgi:hypothetical protein
MLSGRSQTKTPYCVICMKCSKKTNPESRLVIAQWLEVGTESNWTWA